jgi:hypothetical protein
MQITAHGLDRQFTPAGRRFNCERYPELIAERLRQGLVRKPIRADVRPGAIIRGGRYKTMLRNVITVENDTVSFGWWLPVCDEELIIAPADAEQMSGSCRVDEFIEWGCDVIKPGQ